MSDYCRTKKGEDQTFRPRHIWETVSVETLADDGMSKTFLVTEVCANPACRERHEEITRFDFSLEYELALR